MTEDDVANCCIVTGGLFMILSNSLNRSLTSVDITPNSNNQLDVGFRFMKSKYRITIERIEE